MGERTSYAPGTFCWADLSTTDQDAAKAFYSGLFGWEAEDLPLDGGGVYSMMRTGGKDVAAIAAQPPQQRDAGAPPVWNSYIAVEDADAAVEHAKELGGTAHAPAFDVMQAGRMGVIQDPQGAFFLVWQAREHFGAALVNAPGALVWNELQAADLDGATAFYTGLFGWSAEDAPGMAERYVAIKNGEANNGGMRAVTAGMPPSWLVYFGTEDIDAGTERAQELGATKLVGPVDIQIANFSVLQDPQGAVFALYAGELEP
jgi:uncharacterized protein